MGPGREANGRMASAAFAAEVSMLAALSVLLSSFAIFRAPFGGSVTAGGMVGVWIAGRRWGPYGGAVCGLLCGAGHFLIEPVVVHWLQPFLDYGLAFASMGGVAGIRRLPAYAAPVAAVSCRYLVHVLSGVLFFASYGLKKGMNPLAYACAYNAVYLIPDALVSYYLYLALISARPGFVEVGNACPASKGTSPVPSFLSTVRGRATAALAAGGILLLCYILSSAVLRNSG